MPLHGLRPPPIQPVVRRHVEDAAFYWLQLNASLSEPGLRAQRARHMAGLLELHLEGVACAGAPGIELAMQALERWLKSGEAFVAMWAALASGDAAMPARVMRLVARRPDVTLRGVIAGLCWADEQRSIEWAAGMLSQNPVADTPTVVAALRAFAAKQWQVPDWAWWTSHAHPAVRAAACRCTESADIQRLGVLLEDLDRAVRAEAAMSLWRIGHGAEGTAERAAWVLWDCVATQADAVAQATGWDRRQGERRLDRWLRELAWRVPPGHVDVPALLERLPRRAALQFLLHHGDLAQLPLIAEAKKDETHGPWAAWVEQALTGRPTWIGAAHAGAAAAVSGKPAPVPGQRVLCGTELNRNALVALLRPEANQLQALRALAVRALKALGETPVPDLRGPLNKQDRALHALVNRDNEA